MANQLDLSKFALNLYKNLSNGQNENLFVSPFSIASALAMCYIGAKENTAAQLKQVLGFENLDNNGVLALSGELMKSLNALDSVELNVANKIYPMTGFEIKKDFADALIKNFQTEVQSLDFAQNAEAAKTINDWVEQKTKNKITNLVPPQALNSLTRLVLVNAIYFKGSWDKKFDKTKTQPEDFHLKDGSTKKVEMMSLPGKKFKYHNSPNDLKAQILEVPYAGHQVAMTIILPHPGVDINSIESELDNDKLKFMLSDYDIPQPAHLLMPKFKLEHSVELSESISALGAPEAFDQNKANFKGISDIGSGLYISKVLHKAFVDVNEEGTEAAAATGMIMMTRCMPMREIPPIEFKCDRPFLFAIHDKSSGNVLFMGKYMKP